MSSTDHLVGSRTGSGRKSSSFSDGEADRTESVEILLASEKEIQSDKFSSMQWLSTQSTSLTRRIVDQMVAHQYDEKVQIMACRALTAFGCRSAKLGVPELSSKYIARYALHALLRALEIHRPVSAVQSIGWKACYVILVCYHFHETKELLVSKDEVFTSVNVSRDTHELHPGNQGDTDAESVMMWTGRVVRLLRDDSDISLEMLHE